MQNVEPIVGAISTLGGLVGTCYGWYCNRKLSKENAITAKSLADRLRDVSESISSTSESEHNQYVSAILLKISADVEKTSAHVSAVQKQLKKKLGLAAIVDAPSIEAGLRDAFALAIACQHRLESVQLFIAQSHLNDMFLRNWVTLYRKFEQVHVSNIDKSVSNAFHKLNRAARSLLPPANVTEGSSVTTAASISLDDAEDASMEALQGVPAAVRDLVLQASQDRIGSSRLRGIVDEFLSLWDGWHIHYTDIQNEYNRNRQIMLGSGGFGIVFAGKLTRRANEGVKVYRVAIKQIQLGDVEAATVLAEIMREALLHMTLQHHCILRCFGASLPASAGTVEEMKDMLHSEDDSEDALSASIVTERMSSNLADALKGTKRAMHITSVQDKLKIVTDIANAVCFLHDNNIVHRDIKPENVLLNFEGGQLKGYAKLADFGNSRRAHVEQTKRFTSTISRVQGTPLFMPPETLLDVEGCKTTKAWDVWSYGVLLCYVFAYDAIPSINSSQVQMFANDGTLAAKMNSWANKIALENIKEVAMQCLDASIGKRIEQDPISVFSKTVRESAGTTAETIFESAENYRNGTGVEKDEALAVHLYKQAADLGHAQAMTNLGWCYEYGTGVAKDEALAVQMYKRAADLGHAQAIANLGGCFQHGTGVEKDEARAVHLYKQAANLGYARAMTNLGVCFEHGTGVEKNEAHAVQLYKQATDLGHARAMTNLGVCYEYGTGVERDEARAVQLYKQATNLGYAQAITNLAVCFDYGTGIEKDKAHAVQLYKQAANLGHAQAIANLGGCFQHERGVKKDEARAVHLYKQAADLGHAQAMTNLGWCYEYGTGVAKDEALAVQMYKRAADLGHAQAIANLGGCFQHGTGVEKDEARAVHLYKQAANLGYARAMTNLGVCYEYGTGVEMDEAHAVQLYKQAANLGYARAMTNLGVCYEYGRGVEKDEARAVQLYKQAADLRNGTAITKLGFCYEKGIGVVKNRALAAELYQKAADTGDNRGMALLNRLRATLTG